MGFGCNRNHRPDFLTDIASVACVYECREEGVLGDAVIHNVPNTGCAALAQKNVGSTSCSRDAHRSTSMMQHMH